jgi:cardiolipin synthase
MFGYDIETTTKLGFAALAVFYVLGFAHILHALMNARTSQGAIAWVVSLISVPFFAIPLYWLLGRSKFSGYVRARRGNDAEMRRLAADMHERLRGYAVDLPAEDVFERAAEELGGLPFTRGNDLELLIDGQETFRRLFEEIAAARHYICVNFFIVKNDKVGGKFQRALIDKAREGVKVFSFSMRSAPTSFHPLSSANCVTRGWNANRSARTAIGGRGSS